ncbi:MAG: xanthine dehydrogenase family protein molybdopterin-binding subunit, partial [Hyphomicrobiales bacterium]|nr:xanthine dehydrogenase family protein molybdopterin-binding subunit [Hyphomicrobiales bacterium]
MAVTRRAVIAAAAGSLVLAAGGGLVWRASRRWRPPALGEMAWLRIAPDGAVTFLSTVADMGQGSAVDLARLVAEEMDADWGRFEIEAAPVRVEYYPPFDYFTAGSTSVRLWLKQCRRLGATARGMLVHAAANRWDVPTAACDVLRSTVIHRQTGRKLGFGELASAAALLEVPWNVPLKPVPSGRRLSGATDAAAARVDGSMKYGIDLQPDGCKAAALAIAPNVGGRLESCDRDAVREMKGIRAVVELGDSVAVVADDYYRAFKALALLQPKWSRDPDAEREAAESLSMLPAVARGERRAGAVRRIGEWVDDARFGKPGGPTKVATEYAVPLLAHAALEPINAIAQVSAESISVWTATQAPARVRAGIAAEFGIGEDAVEIVPVPAGGSFGRRLDTSYVSTAVRVAAEAGVPVKTLWTREQDLRLGMMRPAAAAFCEASIDDSNSLVAARVRVASLGDDDRLDGWHDHPYEALPLAVELVPVRTPLRVGPWRSVDYSQNLFFLESFLDECCVAMRADPIEARRRWVGRNRRAKRVLDALAVHANAGSSGMPGIGKGVALAQCYDSIIGLVTEVEATGGGQWRVKRIQAIVDCGWTLNTASVEAQIFGGIVFGLTAALHGRVALAEGELRVRNFDDYPLLRGFEVPPIAVEILPALDDLPGGVG